MSNRIVLTKDQILSAKDLVDMEWVDTPEWMGKGSGVYVKQMTAKEKDQYEINLTKEVESGLRKADLSNMRAKLCAQTICHEDGTLIFDPTDSNDLDILGSKSVIVIDRVFAVARKLNSVSDEDLEEMEKNLKEIQTEDLSGD